MFLQAFDEYDYYGELFVITMMIRCEEWESPAGEEVNHQLFNVYFWKLVLMAKHHHYCWSYADDNVARFEEQSHEIKEAQEKLSEIVLAKQVN